MNTKSKKNVAKTVAKSARKSVATKASASAKRAAASKAPRVRIEGGNVIRGRKSALMGKKLFPSIDVKKANPRRKPSLGYVSLEIIRKAPGIAYPDFIAAGGRAKDVKWDIEHGYAVAR